jgi:hypothetical protein
VPPVTGSCLGPCGSAHAASQGSVVLSACMGFSICRPYAPARNLESMRVLIVEDEPYLAEAIRDGLRLEAIAADIAGDGDTALEHHGRHAHGRDRVAVPPDPATGAQR